jgi:hypothetical protein
MNTFKMHYQAPGNESDDLEIPQIVVCDFVSVARRVLGLWEYFAFCCDMEGLQADENQCFSRRWCSSIDTAWKQLYLASCTCCLLQSQTNGPCPILRA